MRRRYEAGEVILRQGDEAVGFFIVSSGAVRVVRDMGSDKEHTLATLAAGEFFGETALMDGYPRTASVQAVEKTECLAMTRWDFMSELKGSPSMAVEDRAGACAPPAPGRRQLEGEHAFTHPEEADTLASALRSSLAEAATWSFPLATGSDGRRIVMSTLGQSGSRHHDPLPVPVHSR